MLAVITEDIKHLPLSFEKAEASHSYQHPKNLNNIICDGKVLGQMGVVHPTVAKKIDKQASIEFLEIDMEVLASVSDSGITYEEASKYPGMEIDLTFVTDKFGPIKSAIAAANCPLIKDVAVTDIYEAEEGTTSTVRIFFGCMDRTLTREEVMAVVDSITADLSAKGINLK